MKEIEKYPFGKVISTNITAMNYDETIQIIERWIEERKNHYICICNTHSLVTASNDDFFSEVLSNAGLCTPDGMPLVWALRAYGFKEQARVDGPNLMLKLCEVSALKKYKLFLYGGSEDTLAQLNDALANSFHHLEIVGSYSPPFRKLSETEESNVIKMINESQADFIFVGLGCPKQEIWMYNHRDKINGIMVGVGAAFDFIAGKIKRPPILFQRLGLEWLFRLINEPRRLWKRYIYNNPVYIFRFIRTYKQNKYITNTIKASHKYERPL